MQIFLLLLPQEGRITSGTKKC